MSRPCPHPRLVVAAATLAATLGSFACDTADGVTQDTPDAEVESDVATEPDTRPDSDLVEAHDTVEDVAIDTDPTDATDATDRNDATDTDHTPEHDADDTADLAEPEDTSTPTCTSGECPVDPAHDLHIDIHTALVAGTLAVEGELRCATLRFIALDAHDQVHEVQLPCSGASRAFTTRLPAPHAYAVDIFMPMTLTIGATPPSSMLGTLSVLPRIDIEHDRTDLALEVAVVSLDGVITQNGAPPIVYPACDGADEVAIDFRETDAPAQVTAYLRCAPLLAFEDVLLHRDRSYAVSVGAWPGRTSLPEDQSLARAAYRPAPDDTIFDVRTATVSGTLTLDGATPATVDCHTRAAQLRFVDRHDGTTQYVQIPCDTDWSFAATLPHGDYEVHVGGEGSNLPGWARVADAVSVPAAAPLALDVATVPAQVTLTLDGGPWPTDGCTTTLATLVLIADDAHASGSYTRLPCTSAGRVVLALPPGTYRAHLSQARLPFVEDPIVFDLNALVTLPSAEPIVLDLRTAELRGTLTLNGAPLADLCDAHPDGLGIAFRPLDAPLRSAWSVLLPCETRGDYALRLPLGAYDAIVASAGGSRLPPQVRVADRIDVTADTHGLDLDVRAVTVSGTITVDGQYPPDEGPCPLHRARAVLRGDRGDASTWAELVIPCGAPSWRFEDVAVPAGAHTVTVDGIRVPHTTLQYRLVFE